jgi:hypothetical protein
MPPTGERVLPMPSSQGKARLSSEQNYLAIPVDRRGTERWGLVRGDAPTCESRTKKSSFATFIAFHYLLSSQLSTPALLNRREIAHTHPERVRYNVCDRDGTLSILQRWLASTLHAFKMERIKAAAPPTFLSILFDLLSIHAIFPFFSIVRI